MRCAWPEHFRQFLLQRRGRLVLHVVLGDFQHLLVLLQTARASRVLWVPFQALSGLPSVNGAQQENTVPICQANHVCCVDQGNTHCPWELSQLTRASTVAWVHSLQQQALPRMKHVLIAAEVNTLTHKAMVQSLCAHLVCRGSFQLNLGLHQSFHASIVLQGNFQQLLAMIQRMIVCNAARGNFCVSRRQLTWNVPGLCIQKVLECAWGRLRCSMPLVL